MDELDRTTALVALRLDGPELPVFVLGYQISAKILVAPAARPLQEVPDVLELVFPQRIVLQVPLDERFELIALCFLVGTEFG